MKAYTIKVHGDVQGVFYRHFTEKEAQRLGVTGWVKNEHDGTVTIHIQGEEGKLKEMIDWANVGSPMATVEKVEIKETEYDDKIWGFKVL